MGWPAGVARSEATRAKMSAARKAAWADPAVRAKMSAASKAAWADQRTRVCDLCQARGVGGMGIVVDRMLDEEGEEFFACRDMQACDARFTGVSEEAS